MKKLLFVSVCVALLGLMVTSCSKGCKCKIKTDVTGMAPVFEDENMSSKDCKDMQKQLNDEAGMDMYRCN